MSEFGYRGEDDTCLWCGEELMRTCRDYHYDKGGQYVPMTGELIAGFDGYFCDTRCGYDFGLAMAVRGKKFIPNKGHA